MFKMAMSLQKRKIIQENFVKITENITDIDSVVDNLFAAGIITDQMKDEIMVKTPRRNKTRYLLSLLPKRGEVAFDIFYKTLIDLEEYIAAFFLEPHVTDRSLIYRGVDNQVLIVPDIQLPEVFPPDNEEEIMVDPCLITDTAMTENYRKSLEPNNNEVYKNTKGLCILLYNECFDEEKGLSELNWDKDVQDLTTLFETLRFEVELRNNWTIGDLKNRLESYKKVDMKAIDVLVVFVMTYGENGRVYGTDGDSINIQFIIDSFYPSSCPDLVSKPKLFFVQTEQKPRENSAVGQQEPVEVSIKNLKIHQSETADATAEPIFGSRGDTYVCFSATSDKFKPNEEDSGSLFIQALIYAYKKFSNSSDLLSLGQKTNDLIKMGERKNGRPATIGSYYVTSLGKTLYFFPGMT